MADRLSQAPAVQDVDEERNEDVQDGTLSKSRSPQRSNADASSDSVRGLAAQQDRAVRKSGKRAVISTGGKQYLVSEGEELEVELLASEPTAAFEALMVIDGEKTSVGAPTVGGVQVKADIIEQIVKQDKVVAIRYKSKKRVHKRRGHRQKLTRIKVSSITQAK